MKRAKDSVPSAPACSRKTAMNSGDAPGGFGSVTAGAPAGILAGAEAIYKHLRMPTVGAMVIRTPVIVAGVVSGVLLGTAVVFLQPAVFFGPDRDLRRNGTYFLTVLDLVRKNYVDEKEADADRLTRAAMDGMVKSLDPHSEFMLAGAYRELREEMDGRFGGIGIQIELRDGKIVVVAPIADTPGERAGIRRADQIVRVDGQNTEKLGMEKVIERLRGRPGTKVTMTLFRPSTKATIDLTLKREIIKVESVRDV
jgi:carboxyl-terminal processing protease